MSIRLRLPIDSTTQGRITGGVSLTETDTPVAQSLKIDFTVDVTGGAPQLRLLYGGTIRFLADETAGGTNPATEADVPTDSATFDGVWAGWKIQGTLIVTCHDKLTNDLDALEVDFPTSLPRVVGYSKIRLTREFLWTTLRNVPSSLSDEAWQRAVFRFLSGQGLVRFAQSAISASADATVAASMPELVMDGTTGAVSLTMTAVVRRPKFNDAVMDQLGDLQLHNALTSTANSPVPCGYVLWALRENFTDSNGALLTEISDASWSEYTPLYFSRTWIHDNSTSKYLAQQTIRITQDGSTLLTERLLPANGIVYVRPTSTPTSLTFSNVSDASVKMKWVDATVENCWRSTATTDDIILTWSTITGNTSHICLRRSMQEEMGLEDPIKVTVSLGLCTAWAMRRTLRAWVDNRLAGGKLSFGVGSTGPKTRALIDDAWADLDIDSSLFADNAPHVPTSDSQKIAMLADFRQVMEAFFPEVPTSLTLTRGAVAYDIWHSEMAQFSAYPDDFSAAYIGRGAPGAIMYLGLGAWVAYPSSQDAGYSYTIQERSDFCTSILNGTGENGLAQYWRYETGFRSIVGRGTPGSTGTGHSLIIRRSIPGEQKVEFIDQMTDTGNARYLDYIPPVYEGSTMTEPAQLNYPGSIPEIWISADWTE